MKRYFSWLISGLFLVSLVVAGFTMQLIAQIRSYGTLINYVGIVRGATQRLVKLELIGEPNDEMIAYLDGILSELNTGEGIYGLVQIQDEDYNADLTQLNVMWEEIKKEIEGVRAGNDVNELAKKSETYFKIANDTVFAANQYSEQQINRLGGLIFTILTATALTWAIALFLNARRQAKLEQDNQGLTNIVYRDALTGAPNLEKFNLDVQKLLRQYPQERFAVFYVDFENFKYLNNIFGRAYGDKLLQEYAKILTRNMAELETFCRIAADNFLILRRYVQRDELLMRQNVVDGQMAAYALATQQQNTVWLCGGVCCREDVGAEMPVEQLIERANFARKTAKNNARVHYAFYDESIREKMIAEKAIENHMQTALENEEYIVYLQPKVALCGNQIECAEALVRWRTADGKLIPPGEFIPLFEKNLFIVKLDQYMMEHVCRWLRARLDAGRPVMPISVNVSRMQLYDPTFVETYADIKRRYRIPNQMVEVEFTESVAFEDMTLLLAIIRAMKQAGFACSLDDFGKGYSSLNLLRRLPVDVLKLDGLFFEKDENEEQTQRARIIVEGIVTMAKHLHLQTVAEGVEHLEQVEFLRGIGCDKVQGYVFYRPMPVAEFEELLDQAR